MSDQERSQQASAYLRMLLLRPGEYRSAWQRRAERPTAGAIDYTAVACVLAHPDGHRDSDDTVDGQLVRAVCGVLEGTDLCPRTLDRFVDAFALRRREAERLAELLRGSAAVRVITNHARGPAGACSGVRPPRHQTLSLHELHVLGPDGWPAEHQTIQVVRATVDGLDSLPYRFDTDELVVEVVRGGRVGDRVYQLGDHLYAVDLLLDEPLTRGDTTLVHYRTTFFYKSQPPTEFRRAILGTAEDLTMWLTFHRDRLPRRIWQARWDAVDHGRVVERTAVELDDELSVHCRCEAVRHTIVGYCWAWD